MGISVTEDTTTIEVSGDTTVTVTENVTSVSVSDSTATLTVQPSETTVAVTGNTTSINVEAETQEILVNESSYLGNFGGQTLNGSLYVTGHLTHGGVLTDTSSIKHTDFTSAGFMRTDGSGNYTVDSNTYLTSFTEVNDLSASVTWADVPDANITETSVTQHQSELSITESQISDLQSYLTSYTETDPVFSAHASSGITATQITQWGIAYGWGDHSGAGYLTSFTETNDLSTSVTWANVPNQNITEGSVTQHQTAINSGVSITESQISDFGTYLTTHQDISGKANLSGDSFTGDVNLGDNNKINIGASSDLQIYHDGSDSYIDEQGTGDLIVKGLSNIKFQRADTGTNMFTIRPNRVESYDASGNLITKVDADGLNVTGELSTTDTITAPNVNISTTGTVTTNIATGANSGASTKVVNIATGYSTGGTTTVNIAPTGSTTTKQINLNGDVSIGGAVTSEIDATIASPSQNTPVLKLRKNSASANGTGRFITFVSSTTSGGSEVTRGLVGLSNTTSPQYSNPFMSHTSGSNGIVFSYSGNSSYNAIAPCSSTGSASNGSLNLGHGFAKWNTVYASSGSINTSDITKKQDIEELSEAESRVAIAAKGLLRKYRWKDSVSEKGDSARIHFGIMAQDLKAAFEAEGLDANKYGMFCADTRWTTDGSDTYATEEEAPEAVTEETVYGVRYEELLAFIIAAI